jgi:hypothetical protein
MMASRRDLAPWANTTVGGKSSLEWSREMSTLWKNKPRPLHKRLGKNPTPDQIAKHKAEERAWNAAYRKASKNQKKSMELENAAYASATDRQRAARVARY